MDRKGKLNPNYKHGKNLKNYSCEGCKNPISVSCGVYGSGFCRKCSNINSIKKRRSYKGKNNPMYNKKHTKVTKNKISFTRIKNKVAKGSNNPNYGNPKLKGDNHPNWQGGISKQGYSYKFNKRLKDEIRKRDKYKCTLCGTSEKELGQKCTIHHIDYNKQNCEKDNLTSLCRKCNSKVNFGRNYWKTIFKKDELIIAFDIDGTLCTPIKSSKSKEEINNCKPYKNIINIIKNLKERGVTILIFTHRSNTLKKETEKWLNKHKIPYDHLIMEKPKYDLYLDDKSYPPYEFLNAKMLEDYAEKVKKWDFNKGGPFNKK